MILTIIFVYYYYYYYYYCYYYYIFLLITDIFYSLQNFGKSEHKWIHNPEREGNLTSKTTLHTMKTLFYQIN